MYWKTKVSLKSKIYELIIFRVFRLFGIDFGFMKIKKVADGDNAQREKPKEI